MPTTFLTLNNTLWAPQYTANGYLGLSGSQLQQTGLADNWEFGGTFTKIIGKHTIKAGGDFQSNNFLSPIAYSNEGFAAQQTAGVGAQQGVGGNAWASLLVGNPASAGYRNIREYASGGWTDGLFVQDQFKATSRLTVNVGYRQDLIWTPIYGSHVGGAGNYYTGNANPITGQYQLNALPPNCSATQGAPCIPTGIYTASSTPAPGGLPPNAYVSPSLRVIQNSFGRLGRPPWLGLPPRGQDSHSRQLQPVLRCVVRDRSALTKLRRQLAGGQHHSEQRLEPQYSNGEHSRSAAASAAAEGWFIPSTTSARSASGWSIRSSGLLTWISGTSACSGSCLRI